MKKEKETTLAKQFLKIVLSHLKALGIIFLVFYFMGVAFWAIHDVVTMIMEILIFVVYIGIMASAGNACATYDLKQYSKTKPFAIKGILLAIPVVLLNLGMWGALQWVHGANMSVTIKNIMQTVFFVWTVPYNFFLKPDGPSVRLIGQIMMYAVPFITIGAGYFAGYKRWDVYAKLDKIVFEQKKTKKK